MKMMNDILSNVLSKVLAYERNSKKDCVVKSSATIKKVMEILQKNGYIGSFEEVQSIRGDNLKINLIGNINRCGVIKPRFSLKFKDFIKFENRYLPAQDFGVLIVSTSQGIMEHQEAKEKGVGGRLIAYCY